jgi:nucleoside-diphosphate-sugar epimerase
VSQSKPTLFRLPAPDLDHIVRLAERDLKILRGSEIFISGGTGFFGKWILGALHHAERELGLEVSISILSRAPEKFAAQHPEIATFPTLQFFRGDVGRFGPGKYRADYILHAATDTTVFTSDEDERHRSRTILRGTRGMIELARTAGAKRLLNISSGAVYGPLAAQPGGAKEDDFSRATAATPYGQAKREAEMLCGESGVDFVTARAFAFLGPHLPLDAHFAAGNFLRDGIRGGPINVHGDGTALRSYLHPADLVVWLLRLLIRGERGRAYNVGSDEAVTTAQLARAIAEAVSPKAEVVIQSAQPQGPQNIYLPDISRARAELDLAVDLPLSEAIARTLAYLKTTAP